MRRVPPKCVVISIFSVLLIWEAAAFGRIAPTEESRPSVQPLNFANACVSPPVVAAVFHPDNFDQAGHAKVLYEAHVHQSWSKNIAPFPWRRWRIRDGLVSEPPPPEIVEEFIRNAASRMEAVEILAHKLDWSISPGYLSVYLRRHNLRVPWRRNTAQLPIDVEKVQEVLRGTNSRREAIERLRAEMRWPVRAENLTTFVKRHALEAPWRRARPQPPRDPAAVQALIAGTRTPEEAIAILRKKLGWVLSQSSLSQYLRRHRLRAEWQRTRGQPRSGDIG